MAVFDATALIHLLEPDAPAIVDPATEAPVSNAKARFDYLVETLERDSKRVIIPAPALSEVLVHADDAIARYLDVLNQSSRFRIVPFDQRAAIELASIVRESSPERSLQVGASGTRASLKFDRQILAIARVQGETTIYSDDGDMDKLGEPLGFDVIRTYDLPAPPPQQQPLF